VVEKPLFFLWSVFIGKYKMNFNTFSKNGSTDVQRVINAPSWSSCIAYLEGAGETISQIIYLQSNTTVIINSPSSNNFYNIILEDDVTSAKFSYLILDDNFSNITTWISQQTGKSVVNIQQQTKSYVVV
jgi:hypothetical protein